MCGGRNRSEEKGKGKKRKMTTAEITAKIIALVEPAAGKLQLKILRFIPGFEWNYLNEIILFSWLK